MVDLVVVVVVVVVVATRSTPQTSPSGSSGTPLAAHTWARSLEVAGEVICHSPRTQYSQGGTETTLPLASGTKGQAPHTHSTREGSQSAHTPHT